MREKVFSKYFFGVTVSSVSATVVPIKYTQKYFVETNVYNSDGQLIATYNRSASINKWVQTFLVFIYPFHTETRKTEELYVEFMHNIFMQMETEKNLSK